MRADADDLKVKEQLRPILGKMGYEIKSCRSIDEGDYWVHFKKEGPS